MNWRYECPVCEWEKEFMEYQEISGCLNCGSLVLIVTDLRDHTQDFIWETDCD